MWCFSLNTTIWATSSEVMENIPIYEPTSAHSLHGYKIIPLIRCAPSYLAFPFSSTLHKVSFSSPSYASSYGWDQHATAAWGHHPKARSKWVWPQSLDKKLFERVASVQDSLALSRPLLPIVLLRVIIQCVLRKGPSSWRMTVRLRIPGCCGCGNVGLAMRRCLDPLKRNPGCVVVSLVTREDLLTWYVLCDIKQWE